MASYDYDLIVLGSGAAGSITAHQVAKAGKSVAVIEHAVVGGDAPSSGDVPRKALFTAAKIYYEAKHASHYGVRGNSLGYNYPSLKAWKNVVVQRTGVQDDEKAFTSNGINLIRGRAYFIDPHTISVGPTHFSAAQFLIATGSRLVVPTIPGLVACGYLTPSDAIDLPRPPKRLAVIGSGSVGCELAQFFAMLGTKVYLVERAKRLLPDETASAGKLLEQVFKNEHSMTVLVDTTVEKVEKVGAARKLTIKVGTRRQSFAADEVLVTGPHHAVTDIGLDNAGVMHRDYGIIVNDYLETSTPHILAAGSCTGLYPTTQAAIYQGQVAAYNILHPKRQQAADYRAVPQVTFTSPEIARVGPSKLELKLSGQRTKQVEVPITLVAQANIEDVGQGFVQITAVQKTNTLVAATIVGPHASELIQELTLAIQHGLSANQVARTIHAFPTWSEAIRVACAKLAHQQ